MIDIYKKKFKISALNIYLVGKLKIQKKINVDTYSRKWFIEN